MTLGMYQVLFSFPEAIRFRAEGSVVPQVVTAVISPRRYLAKRSFLVPSAPKYLEIG